MPQTSHVSRPTFPSQRPVNVDSKNSTTSIKTNVEIGTAQTPAASIWEEAYHWVSNVAKGATNSFSFSTVVDIDYARIAPTGNATPEAVIEYISQLRSAKLSDKELTKCLNKVSAYAAGNKDVELAYRSAAEQMSDPIWKDVAYTNLSVKKKVLPTILNEINVPKHSPHTLRNEFFAIANIQNSLQRRSAFTALALRFVGTEPSLEKSKLEYLTYAKELKTDDQKREALAPFAYIGLNSQQFDMYIDVVKTISSNTAKADCLAAVAKFCPDDAKFQDMVQLIRDLRATSARI